MSTAGAGSVGPTRHPRGSTAPAGITSARFTGIDPRDEDTIALELTPEQVRELEESARQAFSRRAEARKPGDAAPSAPLAKVITAPKEAAAPIIVMSPVTRVAPAKAATSVVANRAVHPAEVLPRPVRTIAKETAQPARPAAGNHSPANDGAAPQALKPRAAEESSRSPVPNIAPPSVTVSGGTRPASWRTRHEFLGLAIVISVPALIAAAVIGFSTMKPDLSAQPRLALAPANEPAPLPPASSSPSPQISQQATAPAAPAIRKPPVKFANPFDRSEVFEFPPGTSRKEARDAVAQKLMERARERQSRRPNRRR